MAGWRPVWLPVELKAPSPAEADDGGVLVATLFFNEDWALTGYSRSVQKAPPPSPTTIAVAAASAASYSANQAPQAPALAAAAPETAIADESDPVLDAAPGGKTPQVVALPAGSDEDAGLRLVD